MKPVRPSKGAAAVPWGFFAVFSGKSERAVIGSEGGGILWRGAGGSLANTWSTAIEPLANPYRVPIQHLSNTYPTPIQHLSNIYPTNCKWLKIRALESRSCTSSEGVGVRYWVE